MIPNAEPDRRAFLRAAVVGAVGVSTSALIAADAEAPAAIDAHSHFYDPMRPQGVPWPGKDDKLLYRRVLPEEFRELTRKHSVGGTIAVEASPWLEDNQWLLDLAAREPFIVGVVGRLDPASDEFPKHFERFAKDGRFRGIRLNHNEIQKGLDQAAFLQNLQLLIKHDRALDVNGGPDLPADTARLAKALPELRIVINHAANVPIDGKPVPAAWLKGMKAAAEGKRVWCKVSGLVETTGRTKRDAPTDGDFYKPELNALWELFGEDRLLYASNWPVCERAASYATVYGITSAYFQAKGKGPLAKFLHDNAVTAYKPVEQRK